MDNRKTKIIGLLVVLAAFLICSINSIAATNPSVIDTDPSTYVIVVMLMLFFLILFSAKEDLRFEFRARNVAYGMAIFVAYVLLLSCSRVSLSFVFQSYRIDALLFSIFLIAPIVLVFGVDGLKRMKHVPLYALFASPMLLFPVLSLNGSFANLNAGLVYGILRLAGVPVVKSGLVISAPFLASITISTSCVSMGIFIALAMFLIPVAYLYDGKVKAKILWIASGIGLMLLLNVFRMSSISLVWAYYGINSALSVFHAFAGQLLFYATIIAMILLAGRYGMHISGMKSRRVKEKRGKKSMDRRLAVPAALAIAFGLMGFALSMQYGSAVYAPALFFTGGNSAISSQMMIDSMTGSLEHANTIVSRLGESGDGMLFSLSQASNLSQVSNETGSKVAYVIATPVYGAERGWLKVNYSSASGARTYTLRNGITMTDEILTSGGYIFDVDYFALPYNYSGTYATINYEIFRQVTNSSAPLCSIDNYKTLGISNYIESSIYNLLRLQLGTGSRKLTCYSYSAAASR